MLDEKLKNNLSELKCPMTGEQIFPLHFKDIAALIEKIIMQVKLAHHSQFMTKIQVGHGAKSWSNLGRL